MNEWVRKRDLKFVEVKKFNLSAKKDDLFFKFLDE